MINPTFKLSDITVRRLIGLVEALNEDTNIMHDTWVNQDMVWRVSETGYKIGKWLDMMETVIQDINNLPTIPDHYNV